MIIDIEITDKDKTFIKKLANELYINPRTNNGHTLERKIRSCYKGEICEKAIRTLLSAERANPEDYSHDIISEYSTVNKVFPEINYSKKNKPRIEVKFMKRSPEQEYITFEWYRFFHLMDCVNNGNVDLVVVCDIEEVTVNNAKVKVLAVLDASVFKDKYTYMMKSKFSDSFFLKGRVIKRENLGHFYWEPKRGLN